MVYKSSTFSTELLQCCIQCPFKFVLDRPSLPSVWESRDFPQSGSTESLERIRESLPSPLYEGVEASNPSNNRSADIPNVCARLLNETEGYTGRRRKDHQSYYEQDHRAHRSLSQTYFYIDVIVFVAITTRQHIQPHTQAWHRGTLRCVPVVGRPLSRCHV